MDYCYVILKNPFKNEQALPVKWKKTKTISHTNINTTSVYCVCNCMIHVQLSHRTRIPLRSRTPNSRTPNSGPSE